MTNTHKTLGLEEVRIVHVETLKRDCIDDLTNEECRVLGHHNIIENVIDQLNTQGYIRTPEPTTDQTRVMEMMADALEFYSTGWERTRYCDSETEQDVYQLWSTDKGDNARKALAEYEKLKGKADDR